MIEVATKLSYVREHNLANEGVRKVGVGLLIVDLDNGKIWVIQEDRSKESTGRIGGTVSFPMESRKPGEFIMGNTVGALAEYGQLHPGEELVWVDGMSYQGRFKLADGVAIDMVVIGIRNLSDSEAVTIDSEEVTAIGWMKPKELLAQPNIRYGAAVLLAHAIEEHWIENFIRAANNPNHVERMINSDFNLTESYYEREKSLDIGR